MIDFLKKWRLPFIITLSAVTIFFLGRLSLFWEISSLRIPAKIVSDVSVKIPVLEFFEKPEGLIKAKINLPEARIVFSDNFLEVNSDGTFQID